MKKALLAGIVGVIAGAGFAVPQVASAAYGYNQTSCKGTPAAGPVYGPSGDQVVCADGLGGTTAGAFDGGAISASTGGASNTGRNCGPDGSTTASARSGRYVVVDGDDSNTANLRGYFGYSDYESGTAENCAHGNNGSGTNSGGSVGVDAAPTVNLPLPIACGFTSGSNYGSTGRDGCYLP